jgi:hypothetical protein
MTRHETQERVAFGRPTEPGRQVIDRHDIFFAFEHGSDKRCSAWNRHRINPWRDAADVLGPRRQFLASNGKYDDVPRSLTDDRLILLPGCT